MSSEFSRNWDPVRSLCVVSVCVTSVVSVAVVLVNHIIEPLIYLKLLMNYRHNLNKDVVGGNAIISLNHKENKP